MARFHMYTCCKNLVLITLVLVVLYVSVRVSNIIPESFVHVGRPPPEPLPNEIGCFRIRENSLPDILDAHPRKDKSIFFHETSCSSYYNNKIIISPRQACAIESAAHMNPDLDVYLLYASPGVIRDEGTTSDRVLKALLRYENLKILRVNYESYTRDTPLEDLYKQEKLELSKYARSHASDVMRYLTLWRYGGIYVDLDTVVIKPLADLGLNFAGAESADFVNSAILSFSSSGKGHHFAQLCLEDLKENFRGDIWGNNGPGVITRLLNRLCGVKLAKEMSNEKCQGLTVFPEETFYPVPWWNWTLYFDSKYNDEVLQRTKNTYVVHIWNHFNEDKKINVTSEVPYSLFAKKHCPEVFAECDKYF